MIITKDRNFYKSLILLSLPMIFQNLITFAVGLADNMMIGGLGDAAVSGVYIGNQIQNTLQIISLGFEGTVLVIASQYWGKRDINSIRKIAALGMVFCVGTGIVFNFVCAVFPEAVFSVFTDKVAVTETGLEYLSVVCWSYVFFGITQSLIAAMRSVESPRIGLIVSVSSLFIDVGLNYILIFGKLGFDALGVRGAAIATLIARIVEAVIMIIYVQCIDKKLKFRLKHIFSFGKLLFFDFVKYGTPIVAGQIVWGINLIVNSIVIGKFDEAVITGASLANTFTSLLQVSMYGISGAVGIIIGVTIGQGKLGRIREYSRTTQIILFLFGLLTSGIFLAVMKPFIGVYDISPEAEEFARRFILVLTVTCPFTFYQAGSQYGLIKAGGSVNYILLNETAFLFLLLIPAGIISANLGFSPLITFILLKCDQIIKAIPVSYCLHRYKWIRSLTRDGI